MDKKRKAPIGSAEPTGATSGGVRSVGGGQYAAPFCGKGSTGAAACQDGLVQRHLRRGAENAIPTSELLRLTGYANARQLQAQIEVERAGGALICSRSGRPGGYFIAENRDELLAFQHTLRRRALSTLRTLRATRRALMNVEGQTVIEVGGPVEL